MRVLVTGIAGFAGSHLAEYLLARGMEVYGLVIPGTSVENLDSVRCHPAYAGHLHLVDADIVLGEPLVRIAENIRPERVYHLAAASSVQRSLNDPIETFRVNTLGTRNLFEAIRRAGGDCRILLISSAEVYGESASRPHPLQEDDALLPISPYAASKAATEILASRYGSQYGLDIIRVRPFPHTGRRHSPQFVLPNWARQLAEAEVGRRPPRLEVGNLEIRRDLSDVRDVVAAYFLALEWGEAGAVYNVCSGNVYTLRELLNRLIGLTHLEVEVVVESERLRLNDLPVLAGRFQALNLQTGWRPIIDLDTTLTDLLSHWRETVACA